MSVYDKTHCNVEVISLQLIKINEKKIVDQFPINIRNIKKKKERKLLKTEEMSFQIKRAQRVYNTMNENKTQAQAYHHKISQ